MKLNENSREFTDQGWDRLYQRLEQDGLIPQDDRTEKRILRMSPLKWTAAAVLFICILSSILVIRDMRTNTTRMLTMNNDENPSTLVSTLEDGSVVYLSELASLQYPDRFPDNKREVSLQGEAFFDVSKNVERPFFIDTKQVRIEVVGTAFNVKSKDDSSFSLSVCRGEVRVTSKNDGRTVAVKAGETALFRSDQLQTIETPETDPFAVYLNRMHFKDQRLADVVRVINMNSDSVQLKIAPELQDRLLTVTFSGDTPATMAQLICMALNLKYIQQQNTITISRPE